MNYVMFRRVADRLKSDPRIRLDIHGVDWLGGDIAEIYEPLGVSRGQVVSKWKARWNSYDLYISADYQIAAGRAKRKVQIFHGISFKGHTYSEKIREYDRAFLIGPYQRRNFAERGILSADDPRMVNVGMPKCDPLARDEFDRTAVLRTLGLKPDRPVVLYAPTWRKEASLNTVGPEILEAVGAMDVTLLVKAHDWCFVPERNRRDWAAWFAGKEREGAPFTLVRDRDITPYLGVADLLISDASSTANEFLLRNRPIVFMEVPELFKKYEDTVDLDTWGQKTGAVAKTPEELPEIIRRELALPEARREIREAAARDYFYNAGTATDAAVRAIYEILELNPP